MAEKKLNVRIQLKYDSYENWTTNDPVLKVGEAAITTVSVKQDGTVNYVPSCLIKIGDGTHKYSELDFVYAKAADVIAACKSETALTTFVNNVIAGAGIATDEALATLTGRVTTAEGDIADLQDLVGDTAVATQIANAIADLDLANTYDAKGAAADVQTALDAYKTSNDGVIAAIKDGTDIDSFKDVETALAGKQAVGDYATKAEAQGYADAKDTTIAAAKAAADAAQADVDALEAKVGTVADDTTVVEMIAAAQAAATYDDTALAGRVTTAEEDIDALAALVGDTAVATQITNAVGAAKTELKGSDTDTDASATIAGAKKYADKLDTAMDARVDALETAIGEGGSVAAQITAEIQKLDKEDAAVEGQYVSAVSEADGVITVTRAALPDYTDTYAPKTHTHAIADVTGLQDALDGKVDDAEFTTLNGKVTTLIGTTEGDDAKSARVIAAEEVAKIVAGADESYDTLKEIADWISSHKTDAAAMNSAIAALEGLVGDDSVSDQITAAIDALKIGDYAKAADLTAAVARIATLEGKAHEHTNKALLDTYTQTEADLADAVAKKHEHTNKTVLDGITAEKVTAWDKVSEKANDADLAAIAKTGNVNDLVQTEGDVLVFDCGSSSVNV